MTAIEFNNQLMNLENSLEKFAYRLTLIKEDAKDLVQETYLKVLINRDKFVNDENLKAWIFTIMKNIFINNYRRRNLQNTYRDQTKESFFINQTQATSSDDPDSAVSSSDIIQNIENLKDGYRIPFKMHINGYKYREIADELNLNMGTVKSRIYLSRKELMDKLKR
jgi:RNA polymerase sigma-70 factor, ECF subfamily